MKRAMYLFMVLVVSSVLISANSVLPASALGIDFSTNDIRMWDPDAEDPVLCGGSSGLIGNNNLQKAFNYFRSKGLSDIQAAGAVGNIYEESKGDPTIAQTGGNTNDPSQFGTDIGVGKAWGLIQWDAGGRAVGYAEDAGLTDPIYLLQTQLDLIYWHMEESSPTGFTNMLENYLTIEDISEATHDFHTKIEGSSDTIEMLEERITSAQQMLDEYGSENGGPVVGIDEEEADSSNTLADLCAVGSNGSVLETAFKYSWKDASTTHRKTLKPEYDIATNKALNNGEYVGPLDEPGVDCGGFVTRVMRDSGVDPTYNSKESGVRDQLWYLKSSGKYRKVDATSSADIPAGAIAIKDGADGVRHTYIVVKDNDYFENNNWVAESSYGGYGGTTLWLAPQAGLTPPYDSSYEYYEFIGDEEEATT